MSNIIYTLILFIFVFGAFTTYINDAGIYTLKVPESGASSDISQAQELNTALTETSKSTSLSGMEQLYIIGTSITGGLLAVFTLGPLLESMGVPLGMIGLLISPLGIVAAF